MFPTSLKTFVHPHSVYRLEYPSHWDQAVQKEGESCGFGPHERDDVGLWISIMPMSLDTDQIQKDLPGLMQQAMKSSEAVNVRRDETLRHYALVADAAKDGQGGHYWIVTGGDVILFASSQVPVAERDAWNPLFQKLMASLQITRDEQHLDRKVANEVLAQLRKRCPDQDFEFHEDNIRGKNQVVYLSNVIREVRSAPSRREEIIRKFAENVTRPVFAELGNEAYDEVRDSIVPALRPRDYINSEGPTRNLHTSEWLANVLICYAIKSNKMLRFVTVDDVARWGIDGQTLHDVALANLARLPWPKELAGCRAKEGGRVILVETGDNLASSRLLHPDLHKLFSGPLGSPFWAGIPCRDRLVVYSDRRDVKKRIGRSILKDFKSSAYAITSRPFLVTHDGIAPSVK